MRGIIGYQIVLSYVEGQNVWQKKETNWTSEKM